MKRTIDVVAGGMAALLALPLIGLLAVGLALSLRAWPFFVQQRVGLDGRPFGFLKLRTLPPEFPAYADKYAIAGIAVPWFARVVRRLHLDELPQLLLVVAGRMSLVGPRPEMPNLHGKLPERFALMRTSVRPGCTGLWQISPAAGRLIGESPEHDLLYLTRSSTRLDVWILWRTALMLVGLGRQVELDDVPTVLLAPQAGLALVEVGEFADWDEIAQLEAELDAAPDLAPALRAS